MPIILVLIQELAAYEKASSSVVATVDSLRSTLSFGANPTPGYARTLLIFHPRSSHSSTSPAPPADSSSTPPVPVVSDECAGFALYFTNYSTWRGAPGIYLEDLFVRPQYRRLGYGKQLLREVAQETLKIGGKRLEWSVLKWNQPSIDFYEGIGAKKLDEWWGMRLDDDEQGDRLTKLAQAGVGVEGE